MSSWSQPLAPLEQFLQYLKSSGEHWCTQFKGPLIHPVDPSNPMILRRLNTLQAVQGFLSSIHQLDLSIFYLNNLHEGKKTASNLHPHYDLGLFFAILLMALFASQLNTQKYLVLLSTRWTWQPFSAVKGDTPGSHSEILCSFLATLLITSSSNRCVSTSKDTSRANKNLITKIREKKQNNLQIQQTQPFNPGLLIPNPSLPKPTGTFVANSMALKTCPEPPAWISSWIP